MTCFGSISSAPRLFCRNSLRQTSWLLPQVLHPSDPATSQIVSAHMKKGHFWGIPSKLLGKSPGVRKLGFYSFGSVGYWKTPNGDNPGAIFNVRTFLGWWVKTWPFWKVVGDLAFESSCGLEHGAFVYHFNPRGVTKSLGWHSSESSLVDKEPNNGLLQRNIPVGSISPTMPREPREKTRGPLLSMKSWLFHRD